MTVIICANERDIHWAFDSRTDDRARANPDTLPGTYWAIAAAFADEPLGLIYFHEVGQSMPTYADPYWLGILAYLKLDLGGDRPPAPITDYPEFLSPDAERIKLVTADYLNASCSIGFDGSKFQAESIIKHNLSSVKIQTAIDYAQKLIDRAAISQIDSQRQLDELFEGLKTENVALIGSDFSNEISDFLTEISDVLNEIYNIDYLL
jgi:hypothetical protein